MHDGKFMAVGTAGHLIQSHGQGFSIEIQANLDKLYEQAGLNPSADQAQFISGKTEADEVLKSIHKTLTDKSIPVVNFSAVFHDKGSLRKLF